jgi:predicted NBD/HSP70 family sugar kinase
MSRTKRIARRKKEKAHQAQIDELIRRAACGDKQAMETIEMFGNYMDAFQAMEMLRHRK